MQRRAAYGPYKIADLRTWFSWQWAWALIGLAVVAALPAMFGDGLVAQAVWASALVLGLTVWGVWVAALPAAQAAAARAALAWHQVQADAAKLATERAAYLAPRHVGNTWHHGSCTINHRTYDAAHRCRQG